MMNAPLASAYQNAYMAHGFMRKSIKLCFVVFYCNLFVNGSQSRPTSSLEICVAVGHALSDLVCPEPVYKSF